MVTYTGKHQHKNDFPQTRDVRLLLTHSTFWRLPAAYFLESTSSEHLAHAGWRIPVAVITFDSLALGKVYPCLDTVNVPQCGEDKAMCKRIVADLATQSPILILVPLVAENFVCTGYAHAKKLGENTSVVMVCTPYLLPILRTVNAKQEVVTWSH